MSIRVEMYCHACPRQCKTTFLVELDENEKIENAPALHNVACLLYGKRASWESDDLPE